MKMRVLDLFSGCGGLALGFSKTGFEVHGVDILKQVPHIFRQNRIGSAQVADLHREKVFGEYDVVVGGPPCRPWSAINVRLRKDKHPDYHLLSAYFKHITYLKPYIFIMENVPPARQDVEKALKAFSRNCYNTKIRTVCYSDWGAAIRRRRMFVVGIKDDVGKTAEEFFTILERHKRRAKTVREAIGNISNLKNDPDHVFPSFRTIHKYMKYYQTGKYGWYILKWDEPSPSFGNIMKTYILHPDSLNGGPIRVISVREAMCIMGFPRNFVFPSNIGLSLRYQMIADAVSPIFSRALALTTREVLKKC